MGYHAIAVKEENNLLFDEFEAYGISFGLGKTFYYIIPNNRTDITSVYPLLGIEPMLSVQILIGLLNLNSQISSNDKKLLSDIVVADMGNCSEYITYKMHIELNASEYTEILDAYEKTTVTRVPNSMATRMNKIRRKASEYNV